MRMTVWSGSDGWYLAAEVANRRSEMWRAPGRPHLLRWTVCGATEHQQRRACVDGLEPASGPAPRRAPRAPR